uniref:CUB domain-containing protein n=1 Tax=Ursus americanus TaxID=9643 RepID=A0A452R9T3_URSAM
MDMFPLTWVFLALYFSGHEVRGQPDSPCGGRLNSKDAGYITSPGYPQDYPSHQNCEWIVYAPEPNQKIVLNFNPHFEIEKHDCKLHYLTSSLILSPSPVSPPFPISLSFLLIFVFRKTHPVLSISHSARYF